MLRATYGGYLDLD